MRHVGGQRAAYSRDELRRQRFERGARVAKDVGRRLRDDFDRPQLQCPNGRLRPGAGMRADDDDGPRRFRHDVADGAEAIELRHLEIERHDVRLVLMDLPQRIQSVTRRRDHAEFARLRIAATQHVDQHAPHQRAVVRHDDGRFGRGETFR